MLWKQQTNDASVNRKEMLDDAESFDIHRIVSEGGLEPPNPRNIDV